PAVDAVPDADLDLRQSGKDVELVEDDAADAVHLDRVAQRHEIEPAASPLASGRRAVFTAALNEMCAHLIVQLGRQRTRANPGGVRLEDTDHLVDLARPHSPTGARPARDRVARRDIWIRAVIKVEQRSL